MVVQYTLFLWVLDSLVGHSKHLIFTNDPTPPYPPKAQFRAFASALNSGWICVVGSSVHYNHQVIEARAVRVS